MSEEGNEHRSRLTLQIPTITQDTPSQTLGHLVSRSKSSEKANLDVMETQMSIKKRRNLSKNRGQAARQREKTPEPGRTPIPHEDTPTSDDEDYKPRNSREIEADNTYEEMKRLVQEKSSVKDPVYDLDIESVIEARAMAANERRRRSVSPFAVLEKDQEEFATRLERKGSFTDPTNKLLSTTYTLSPKDEDTGRRSSLTFEPPPERKRSLTPTSPASASPKDTNFPYPFPSTPKKLEAMVYPDEHAAKSEDKLKLPKTPVKKEVSPFDQKDEVQEKKPVTKPKTPETPSIPGELVTKVYQIERTPSRKVLPENRPVVEVRERIVRTPSRKTNDGRPSIVKQMIKPKDEPPQIQPKVPPVKPARSKSATRFGGKTSESEMSEDQINQQNLPAQSSRRKVVPTPRRFVRNRSPRGNRSQSVNRAEDVKVVDKTGTGMSQTSKEIIELMQQARARSLSIPKDDPRLLPEYKQSINKKLQTPNKTPSTPRRTRGISCPKTIQIISDREILSGLSSDKTAGIKSEKQSRQSSGYIDASQSEYTSSCYSSSASENGYDFDLSERTAELTRKLHLLSQEVDKREDRNNIILAHNNNTTQHVENKSGLRKRSMTEAKNGVKKEKKDDKEKDKEKQIKTKVGDEKKNLVKYKWKFIANWQQFKMEQKSAYNSIISLRNQCICDFFLLFTLCGLGGIMFKTLEGSFENAYKCSTRNVKRDFIENLWRGSHYLREEDWKSMARNKLYEFENQLHTAHEAGVTSFSGQRSWNFMNSFVYCLTLITTIGYGHIAPKTMSGRIATIVYAIIGIPLFLIVLADFGKLFTRIIKFLWSFIRRFYYTRSCKRVRRVTRVESMVNMVTEAVRRPSQIFTTQDDLEGKPEGNGDPPLVERKSSDAPPPLPPKPGQQQSAIENFNEPTTPAPSDFVIDEEFNLPISIAIFILVLYIVIGAVIYNFWEHWDFFESFYFVFISMTTIGLGDYVPKHPMFMMMSILYLVFGLALMSMCINVVQVKLSNTFKTASRKLADTVGLPIAEEESLSGNNPIDPTDIVPVHKGKSKSGEDKNKEENESESKEPKDKYVQINCD